MGGILCGEEQEQPEKAKESLVTVNKNLNEANTEEANMIVKAKVVVWNEKEKNPRFVCEEHYGLLGIDSEGKDNKVLTVPIKGYLISLKNEKDIPNIKHKDEVDPACFKRGMEERAKQVDIV